MTFVIHFYATYIYCMYICAVFYHSNITILIIWRY